MSAVDTLFLDTNVLVYAHDRSEPVKGPIAHGLLPQLLAHGKPIVSLQVLSEFYWAVTPKIAMPLTHDEASAELRRLVSLTIVVPVSWQLLERALDSVVAHQLPLWDAQIWRPRAKAEPLASSRRTFNTEEASIK